MRRTWTLSIVLCAAIVASVGASSADASLHAPRFHGTPSVRYHGTKVFAVYRVDRSIKHLDAQLFGVDPHLRVGDRMHITHSDSFPSRIGRPSRHCYVAELLQSSPRHRFRRGAHWRMLSFSGGTTVRHTVRVTMKPTAHLTGNGRPHHFTRWQRQAARRLHCGTPL